MLSIQLLRESPDLVRRALELRNTEAPLDEAIALDTERRSLLTEVEAVRAERNALSKEIGQLAREMKQEDTKEAKHAEHRRSDLMARSTFLGEQLEQRGRAAEAARRGAARGAAADPEHPGRDARPSARTRSGNVVVRQSGEPPSLGFEAKPHWELGESLGIIDFERGREAGGQPVLRAEGRGRAAAAGADQLDGGLPRGARLHARSTRRR